MRTIPPHLMWMILLVLFDCRRVECHHIMIMEVKLSSAFFSSSKPVFLHSLDLDSFLPLNVWKPLVQLELQIRIAEAFQFVLLVFSISSEKHFPSLSRTLSRI